MSSSSNPRRIPAANRSPRSAVRQRVVRVVGVAGVGVALLVAAAGASAAAFLTTHTVFGTVASTVPASGDVNPYGVAVVPRSVGRLHAGSVLVSNFNAKSNQQGTGESIVAVTPSGHTSVFATITPSQVAGRCPGGVGLTTALSVLRRGYVIVGSLPTSDGTAATAKAGCLIVLNASGRVVETITGRPINGPWDMTSVDNTNVATLFVANVLNGTVAAHGAIVNHGTIVRIKLSLRPAVPRILEERVIASGFAEHSDPNALVVGPTGLAFGRHDTLFVADTAQNRIAAIPAPLTRMVDAYGGADVSAGGLLNQPLGLAVAPGGDVLAVNAGDGNIVEISPDGAQVAHETISVAGGGALFGLALRPDGHGLYFVDDALNTLQLLQ
jgi:hypothetical protein